MPDTPVTDLVQADCYSFLIVILLQKKCLANQPVPLCKTTPAVIPPPPPLKFALELRCSKWPWTYAPPPGIGADFSTFGRYLAPGLSGSQMAATYYSRHSLEGCIARCSGWRESALLPKSPLSLRELKCAEDYGRRIPPSAVYEVSRKSCFGVRSIGSTG